MYKEMASPSKRGKIVVSDGYLAVTPEYYRSISAAMKNTLDYFLGTGTNFILKNAREMVSKLHIRISMIHKILTCNYFERGLKSPTNKSQGDKERSKTKFALLFSVVLIFPCQSPHALLSLPCDLESSSVVGLPAVFPPVARQYQNSC